MSGGGPTTTAGTTSPHQDAPSDVDAWITPLKLGAGVEHEQAVRALHELLLRASRFEVHRRATALGCALDTELDDIAMQAANDALVAVLARLDDFEGRSRFTTWTYKFAIHIAGVAVRRHAWRNHAMRAPDHELAALVDRSQDPAAEAQERDLMRRIIDGIALLTPHQRTVLLLLAVDGVPIDVLAERLSTNRNALYKTLHDARRRLRRLVDESEVTP
jgi:RNA polymerase sigma-70 factor (ECF subfamily)